jgi:Ni/Co efflux regulator RcnB
MNTRITLALCAALALPLAAQAAAARMDATDKGVATLQKTDAKAEKPKASTKDRAKLAKAQAKQDKANKQKAHKPKQAPAT